MNQCDHEKAARNAWEIFKQTQRMQDCLLEIFIDDFMHFEEYEDNLSVSSQELPF